MLDRNPEVYQTSYMMVLNQIAEANLAIAQLEESRSKLMEMLTDIRQLYKNRFGKEIREQLDG